MEQGGCRITTIGKQRKVSAVLRIAVAEGNFCMKMRRLKRRKGDWFGKQFEGVRCGKQKVEWKVSWRVGR